MQTNPLTPFVSVDEILGQYVYEYVNSMNTRATNRYVFPEAIIPS